MSLKADEEAAAAAAAEMDELGKRKFFPRVRHLINNKEWEHFLNGTLEAIDAAGAPSCAAASHKASNPWYKAFDLVYGGVAADYSIPTGKNRYHKFKDKIVEVWTALEQEAPADHSCRNKAVLQLETYRAACADANKPALGSAGTPRAARASVGGTPRSMPVASAKRGLAGPPAGSMYKNLDEKAVIETLPEKLQQLLHLRQLQKEMVASTVVKMTKKNLQDHAKKVENEYLGALKEYTGIDEDGELKEEPELSKDEAFTKSQGLALLYRYSNPGLEQRNISLAYQSAVDQYLAHIADPIASV